jgi:hypothetical protein
VIGVDPTLDQLRPIELDELVTRAALLTRRDRKYVLPAAELPRMLSGLGPDVRVLRIDGEREFAYRSVYYDTVGLDSYLAAARRRLRRFKVRIRSYLDTGGSFLEVKTQLARNATVKHRFPHPGAGGLDAAAYATIDAVLAGLPSGRGGPLESTVVTHYRRTTLFVPPTGGRVTIDTDLRWALPDGPGMRIPNRVIVETKTPGAAAGPVDRLLWSLRHRPLALSKFGTGLAMLRPDLPANRWHPVLRRHLFPPISDRFPPMTDQYSPMSDR